MTTVLIILGCIIGFVVYSVLGVVIGATVYKRSNASWRWWNSNIGEFVMLFGLLGLFLYIPFWPLWVFAQCIDLAIRYRKNRRFFKKAKSTVGSTTFKNFDSGSQYPTIVMDYKDKALAERYNTPKDS